MTAALELYREQLWQGLLQVTVDLEELEVGRDELQRRIDTDGFDGGHTAAWARELTAAGRAEWRSVRDRRTGHIIHCITDRIATSEELTQDLLLGLRLMSWMRGVGAPITWYWWDQPWKRYMPARTAPSRNHLNGGWAVPGVPEVHVYRREEAHKVLLHETIHAILLDVPHDLMVPVREAFERELGGRRLWPHLGEAYTELMAEWLWAIAGSKSLADARRRWQLQRQCARRQAGEIWLRIRGLPPTAAEDTNAFAYYVLKYVLMLHEEDVLLTPVGSVPFWLSWWRAALPNLDRIASALSGSDNREISMGMTCGYS